MALRGLRFLCFYDPKAGSKPAFYGQKFFQKERHILRFSSDLFLVGKYANLSPSEKCSICRILGEKVFRISYLGVLAFYGRPSIGCLNGLS